MAAIHLLQIESAATIASLVISSVTLVGTLISIGIIYGGYKAFKETTEKQITALESNHKKLDEEMQAAIKHNEGMIHEVKEAVIRCEGKVQTLFSEVKRMEGNLSDNHREVKDFFMQLIKKNG